MEIILIHQIQETLFIKAIGLCLNPGLITEGIDSLRQIIICLALQK